VSIPEVRVYDFRRPEGLDRAAMTTVRTLFDLFARLGSARLGSALHSRVALAVESVIQGEWGQFEQELSEHGAVLGVELVPCPAQLVCYLPHELTTTMIDLRLAGPGRRSYPARPLSDLERRVLAVPFDAVSRALGDAATSVTAQVSLGRVQEPSGLQRLQLLDHGEPCIIVRMTVRLPGGIEHQLSWCAPVSTLRPIVEAVEGRNAARQQRERPRSVELARLAAEIPTTMVLRFPDTQVTLGVLGALEPGSVLALGHPIDEPLVLEVGGAPLFRANRVLRGRRLAAQITEVLGDEERAAGSHGATEIVPDREGQEGLTRAPALAGGVMELPGERGTESAGHDASRPGERNVED